MTTTHHDHAYTASCKACGEEKPLLEFTEGTPIGGSSTQCLECASKQATQKADRLRLAHQAMERLHPDIYQASAEAVDECLIPDYLKGRPSADA